MEDKPLTRNQQRFVDEYLVDRNGARAYKAAYPNVKKYMAASNCASKLLKKTYIQKKVDEGLVEQQKRTQIDQDFVLNGIVKNIKWCEDPENYQSKSALKGYELIGRHLKMFTDKMDHGMSGDTAAAIKDIIGKAQGGE